MLLRLHCSRRCFRGERRGRGGRLWCGRRFRCRQGCLCRLRCGLRGFSGRGHYGRSAGRRGQEGIVPHFPGYDFVFRLRRQIFKSNLAVIIYRYPCKAVVDAILQPCLRLKYLYAVRPLRIHLRGIRRGLLLPFRQVLRGRWRIRGSGTLGRRRCFCRFRRFCGNRSCGLHWGLCRFGNCCRGQRFYRVGCFVRRILFIQFRAVSAACQIVRRNSSGSSDAQR